MKILYTAAILLSLLSPAVAQDAPVCKIAPAAETLNTLVERGAKVSPVSEGEVATLTDAKGLPPGADGNSFTVQRIDIDDFSALVIIQGDCINDKIGPVPSQLIDNALGSVKASG